MFRNSHTRCNKTQQKTKKLWSASGRDWSCVLFELQSKERETEELRAKYEERKQVLENLEQRIEELHKNIKETQKLHLSFDVFLKDEDPDKTAKKAERDRKEVLQKEAEMTKLKEECAEVSERKQKRQRQVHRHSVYRQFMEQVCKITEFEHVEALMGHLESLLHVRQQLSQRENKAQEQIDQQRKVLLTLEDQHNLLRLQQNNRFSQLQTKLERTRSEALTWERRWNHIQETTAKKTLKLGQIKMVTLNLYETTGGSFEGEGDVDMNDTEKQLDQVRMFFEDHNDMVKQLQSPLQRHNDGQKLEEAKKAHQTQYKKAYFK
ncbi:coiled-coil domain-containing protein 42 homolog [Stegastes partitus]|uniref:Coiled-coil domain-containing protein 42 homolog n=1 Tax=Stegastes partitus TaxID=144197 RepID=A0A9Y4MYH0_9TELE|nr:PREDICTED: coiled-coil domain-containing protein 42B [Stegastes partitus]